ncbi:MAG: DUF4255 domain-containing protein [Bacteroidetes bacterium]|nr:DUF4255 domain-containing protein [Bacteroidota bacterium]
MEDQANLYLQGLLGPSTEKYVTIGNIAKIVENDTVPNDGNGSAGVILSLVNIEEDRISKNPDGIYRTHNSVIKRNPEILLNLYILFSANTGNYITALSRISNIIQCFQSTNFFTKESYPSLDPKIDKLHLELYTMNFEQINHLWSTLGGKYLPSVLYKMKLVTIVDEDNKVDGSLIREIKINKNAMIESL